MKKLDGRKLDHKTLEEIRIRAVHAVQDGAHPEDVVKALGLGKRCIYNWLAAYRAGGYSQLKAKRLFGRPTKLNGPQIAWLYRTIAGSTPLQHRFEFALWTIKLVQWLIHDEWKIKLSRSSVHRLMRQLGLSCQRPLDRAYEQNPVRVAAWKEQEFPAIRRLAQEAGAEIWFGDESGVRSDYHAGTTWGAKGTTPVVLKSGQRFKFNLLSVINNLGEMRFMLTEERVNNVLYIEFLKRVLTGATKPIFLILDGHPVHRSKAVKEFAASTGGMLRLFYLPGYSPELNPDEQVWNEIKYRKVGRRFARTKEELKRLLYASLHALQKMPARVRSFFQLPDTRYAAC
jgi:transposase